MAATDPDPKNPRSEDEGKPADAEQEDQREGESRREFIKKLPYVAPVIETFLLSETAYGDDDDERDTDRAGRRRTRRRRRRRRRRISPVAPDRRPPPPPPPRRKRDRDD